MYEVWYNMYKLKSVNSIDTYVFQRSFTMAESQIIEYKESWRDEYLKWICGFANAQGGIIYIGINDNGEVIGVKNIKKLLEDIPNKVRDKLGIIVDVNRLEKDGIEYIEIIVAPSSFPVNYHGEYHYRTGSTKQQLTGIALSEFIMKKTGIRWEDVTVDDITVDDLDDESFKIFRKEALRSRRMTKAELDITNEELLSKLHLLSDGKLKRSAVLLFYGEPSRIQNGSYVKIGKFGEGSDLQYQDTLEGSLITTAERVIDLIYLKYLKAKISYEHDKRIETYPFARDAIREAVYNAIAHNCYMFGVPIQIRIEDEALIISNSCILPDGWTIDTLMMPHDSRPYNPDIANVFYRAGYIEHWGRGIEKICDACKEIGADEPKYELIGNGLRIQFKALSKALFKETKAPKHQSTKAPSALEDNIITQIRSDPNISQAELADILGVSRRIIQKLMNELKNSGRIQRVGGKRFGHWEIID